MLPFVPEDSQITAGPAAHEPPPDAEASTPARQSGRVRFDGLKCDLGRIVDMSSSGMGVISRSAMTEHVGTTIGFKISARWCEPFVLAGQVRWSRKVGFMKHHIGLAFVNLTPDQRRRLNELAAGIGSREYGWSKL